jgi:2-polyprenyl-6-methoxyphenol hydroxylase-like FAD-dependent oxidoreductase
MYDHGAYIHMDRAAPRKGNCAERDRSRKNSLDVAPVGIVRAQELEKYLYEKVQKFAITKVPKQAPDCVKFNDGFALLEDGEEKWYDLIVVCEGAGSTTRKAVGIKSVDLTRKLTHINGQVKLQRQGMVIQYLHAARQKNKRNKAVEEILLSALLSTNNYPWCWVIGEVSSECLAEIAMLQQQAKEEAEAIKEAKKRKEPTKDMQAAMRRINGAIKEAKETEFRKIAARTMLETDSNIKKAGYRGVVKKVETFTMQARISSAAFAGDNLVLAGDAVGNGHWSVGGGMHVAGMCHQKRLDNLAAELRKAPNNRLNAIRKYNRGALADTIAWISRGIEHHYMSIPKDVLDAVFGKLVREVLKDNNIDVPEAIRERVTSMYFDGFIPTPK